ncbi:MAG: NAD(P)-binding domain-containing protein, partial [Clostridia bacterium]|nr:NAD(P)-binding domain-containing protein [Clostridia bacterium]
MNSQRIWAIIGGGNGGQTMAGHLGVMGERVRLFDVVQSTVDKINETKKINLHHAIEGVGEIEFATTDISQALDKADNVIVVLPTIYHDSIAEKMAPYLKDGQVILLHPESCCGAIAFRLLLERLNCRAKVVVGCVSNLLYATRATQPGEVYVHSVKRSVNIAAIPATDNQRLYDAVGDKFPQFKLTDHVLKISL